jgi:hypothetical protein
MKISKFLKEIRRFIKIQKYLWVFNPKITVVLWIHHWPNHPHLHHLDILKGHLQYYFESLTPALEDDMWSIESLEDVGHFNDELQFFPCRVVFKEKKKIRIDRRKPDDEPYISCYTSPSPNFDDKEIIYSNLDDSNIKKDVKKAPNEGFNLLKWDLHRNYWR